MSKSQVQKVACPSCSKEHDVRVWGSINNKLNPEIKGKILNRELFRFICPVCGHDAYLEYSFLFHDPDKKYMVYYVTDEENYRRACDILKRGMKAQVAELGMEIDASQGYTNRVVTTMNAFREKLLVLDEGLDDKTVEIIKTLLLTKIREEQPDTHIDDMYLYRRENGEYGVQFLSMGKGHSAVAVSREMYERVKSDFADAVAKMPSDDVAININWVSRLFNSMK